MISSKRKRKLWLERMWCRIHTDPNQLPSMRNVPQNILEAPYPNTHFSPASHGSNHIQQETFWIHVDKYILSTTGEFLHSLSPHTFHVIVDAFAEMLGKAKPRAPSRLAGPSWAFGEIPLTQALGVTDQPMDKNPLSTAHLLSLSAEVTSVKPWLDQQFPTLSQWTHSQARSDVGIRLWLEMLTFTN